jgi:hypothetical protein
MLTEIPFYIVTFAPVIVLIVAAVVLFSFIGNLTAKPKPPEHVDTPEEMAERKARVFKMMAEMAEARAASHHH